MAATTPLPVPSVVSAAPQHQGTNRMVSGGYKKLKLIGSGADGKVFQAILGVSGTVFAVKEVVITPNTRGAKGVTGPLALTDAEESRIVTMRRQVDKLRTLPFHANIVKHFGTERTTCALNVMMEYVEGGSIESFLKKLGPLSEGTVRHFTRGICHGLAFLHQKAIIHRDIKGANCLVNKQGTVKIADFGSCEMPEEAAGQQTGRGKNQPLKGTSMWMAPEAIMQEEAVTPHADIWSLGCTVVEMASGKAPWHEARFTNEWAAMFHISQCGHGPPIPLQLSRQGHDFLSKCFEIDPSKRFTADECLDHPFLKMDFDPKSADQSMQPPLLSELQPRPKLPTLRRSPSLDGTTISDDDSSTPSYSSIQSFAVYDHEMGDAEDDGYEEVLTSSSSNNRDESTATSERRVSDGDSSSVVVVGEQRRVSAVGLSDIIDTIVSEGRSLAATTNATTQHDVAAPKGNLLSSGRQYTSIPALGQFHIPNSSSIPQLSEDGREHSLSNNNNSLVGTPVGGDHPSLMTSKALMEIDIGSSQMEHVDTDSQTFDEIDEHGFSLPEPILFNVLHFLGARDLCYISMVKRSLHTFVNTGAREVLWRHLFIASFGDVDSVRDTLRTNWKDFYKNSTLAKKDYQAGLTSVEDRKYYFQRQLCHSNAVFEGRVEDGTAPSVRIVIKVEKWAQSKMDRRILGASGSFARVGTPLENTPTRRRIPPSRQLSGLCKTPQVANYPMNGGGGGSNSPDVGLSPSSSTSPGLRPSAPAANGTRLPPGARRMPTTSPAPHIVGTFANGSPNKGLPPRTPRHVSPGTGLNPSSPYRLPRLGGYVPPQLNNPANRPSLVALQAPSSAGANSTAGSYGLSIRQVGRRASGPQQKRSYQFVQPAGTHINTNNNTTTASQEGGVSLPPKPSASSSATPPLGTLRRGGTPMSSGHPVIPTTPDTSPNSSHHLSQSQVMMSSPLTPSKSAPLPVHSSPLVTMTSSGTFAPPTSHGGPSGTRNGGAESLPGRIGTLSSPPPRTAERSVRPKDLEGVALMDLCKAYDVPISTTVSRPDRSLVQHQYKLLKHLEYFNAKCIPRVFGFIESDQYRCNFLVTSALGPSVHELLHLCGNQFSLQTVLRLGVRLIGCVEEIHERDVVHGNLTPRNLLVGPPDSMTAANSMFLVNFSHGHFFRNPKTHRPNTTGTTSITAERAQKQNEFLWFCSKFVQDRCTPAPRDDLISVLYVLCYLLHGSLPWMSSEGRKLSRVEMLKLKSKYPDVLQQAAEASPSTTPRPLYQYLKTCHSLRQNEIPDYPYLKSLFVQAMSERQIKDDSSFDWSKMYPCEV